MHFDAGTGPANLPYRDSWRRTYGTSEISFENSQAITVRLKEQRDRYDNPNPILNLAGGRIRRVRMRHPFACIQALWLKAKLIAWVMSVTGLGKVVSDHLVVAARY